MDDNISFVKLYRKILGWEWYTDVPTKTLFIHLLIVANRYPTRWRGQEIKTGQKITSLANLAEETGLTLQQTRTALKKLEKNGELSIKSTNKFTLITVENYTEYQCTKDESNNQITNEQQSNNNQITTNKKVKKDKESKESKESKEYIYTPQPPQRGRRAREGERFRPPTLEEVQAYCDEQKNGVNAERFVSFYKSKNWYIGKNKMKNWQEAVNTWGTRKKENLPKKPELSEETREALGLNRPEIPEDLREAFDMC